MEASVGNSEMIDFQALGYSEVKSELGVLIAR